MPVSHTNGPPSAITPSPRFIASSYNAAVPRFQWIGPGLVIPIVCKRDSEDIVQDFIFPRRLFATGRAWGKDPRTIMAGCEEMMQSYIVSQPALRRRPKLVRGNETRFNTTERATDHIQHRTDLKTNDLLCRTQKTTRTSDSTWASGRYVLRRKPSAPRP